MSVQGYRVIKGLDNHRHSFGGDHWDTPICSNCNAKMHLIFTFDLTDKRLEILRNRSLESLPLVSCLNCSSYWSRQIFSIDSRNRVVKVVKQYDDEKWQSDDEDKLPYPLPYSNVKIVELQKVDSPDVDSDLAFEIFGSEYFCRIIGTPLFTTESIQQTCELCGEGMQYIATICSEDYGFEGMIHEGFAFQFGESYLYFSLCKNCNRVETDMRST